jgi:hypothetical protein
LICRLYTHARERAQKEAREPYRLRKVVRSEPLAAPRGTASPFVSLQPGSRSQSKTMSEDADFLREQARRCRRLAGSVLTRDVVETLNRMAEEYDARAATLEGETPPD